jgi:hypothetical protein
MACGFAHRFIDDKREMLAFAYMLPRTAQAFTRNHTGQSSNPVVE